MKAFALITLVLAPFVGCAAALPHTTDADALRVSSAYPGTTQARLEQGRSLYVERCAGCHELREPASETPLAWPHVVAEMRDEHGVHLTRDEEQGIVSYLVSVSSR